MVSYMPAGSATADITDVYPLEDGYGFHSATCYPTDVNASSGLGASWLTKMWIPPNQIIGRAATIITTVAAGAASLAGFAIYNVDGTSKLGETPHDATLFTSLGLREKDLSAPIAASSTGRFVQVLIVQNHVTNGPNVGFATSASPEIINSNGRRSQFGGGQATYPATVNPASYGTVTEFLPLIFLGE